jgi:hypothetical protein
MEIVRAALHHNVNRSSAGVAIGRVRLKSLHFDFAHRIHRRVIRDTPVLRHIRRAIEQELIALALATAHRKARRAAVIERPCESRIGARCHSER